MSKWHWPTFVPLLHANFMPNVGQSVIGQCQRLVAMGKRGQRPLSGAAVVVWSKDVSEVVLSKESVHVFFRARVVCGRRFAMIRVWFEVSSPFVVDRTS